MTALREYVGPDGRLVAKETALYEDDQLKRFSVDELQIQAGGHATFKVASDGKTGVQFEYQVAGGPKKTATEEISGPILVSDTLPNFIAERWTALASRKRVSFHYAVIPRLETVAFTLRQIGRGGTSKDPAVEIEMRPASWIVSKLVAPVIFTVETAAPHRILRYTGRTTPKIREGKAWADFDAVTIFDW